MRGKRGDGSSSRRAGRIIPAHAGQTWFKAGDAINSPDHPRACGANKNDARSSLPLAGSSPRMRGKQVYPAQPDGSQRIIPAHAGQTSSKPANSPPSADHPRACGANPPTSRYPWIRLGSSPRMRGKRTPAMPPSCSIRIIPAHAGQTLPSLFCCRFPSDHPRACGANLAVGVMIAPALGSSPRMRGKHYLVAYNDYPERIIPAHAGQTD